MNNLMSAQEASKISIKNKPDTELEVVLNWLNSSISNACDNGKFKLEMDIHSWHIKTNSRGFEVKNLLKRQGYKFEDYYETVNNFDNHNQPTEVKKVRISWGDAS